jgi:hypothetical protein
VEVAQVGNGEEPGVDAGLFVGVKESGPAQQPAAFVVIAGDGYGRTAQVVQVEIVAAVLRGGSARGENQKEGGGGKAFQAIAPAPALAPPL